ncbi:MAG: RES family NAD+ phosphorylase [Proteobacteria bacterium]|nr:RES family NAD+ phosphorylase [Pseudomonadota bacterium]
MALFDTLIDLDARVTRNIVSLRVSQDLFDDLVDDAAARAAAIAADMRVRHAPPGIIERGLLYSEAIGYPFTSDVTVSSRFGDGTVRVWYGAMDEPTARAETCWHALQQVLALEGETDVVVRYRAVYQVRAQGLFLELRDKHVDHPEILSNDYAATQAIGKHAASQGLPGLLYASARCRDGSCLAAFRPDPLSEATLLHYLTYRIDPVRQTIEVERTPGVLDELVHAGDLKRN